MSSGSKPLSGSRPQKEGQKDSLGSALWTTYLGESNLLFLPSWEANDRKNDQVTLPPRLTRVHCRMRKRINLPHLQPRQTQVDLLAVYDLDKGLQANIFQRAVSINEKQLLNYLRDQSDFDIRLWQNGIHTKPQRTSRSELSGSWGTSGYGHSKQSRYLAILIASEGHRANKYHHLPGHSHKKSLSFRSMVVISRIQRMLTSDDLVFHKNNATRKLIITSYETWQNLHG